MAYSDKEKEQIIDTICERITQGLSLRKALLFDGMPDITTFYRWIDEDKNKSKQYARACELRAENIFEDIISIADDQEEDVIIGEDGKQITNHNVINRARLRVDARKWMLAKMMPKKYGDKVDLTSGGKPLESKPERIEVEFKDFSKDED